jgi:TrmH family RNA methyltransferase
LITSPHNDKLKDLRKLAKKRDGRFVAEGEDLLDAATSAGWEAVDTFVTPDAGRAGTVVDAELLAKASTLGSGTRAIGVYEQRWAEQATGPLVVALWGVGDPGNVGTILRGALAFGATSVALGPGCADPFGPKAVRASMGAIFHVPVTRVQTIDALPAPRIALVARAGAPLQGPLDQATLVVGAERTGLPAEVVAGCEHVAHLPIAAASESLNAAMAATIAMYEVTKRVNQPCP